ncbi:hypothetical protein OTK49_03360 [Vibrio coralliirubri]|uniref:hypothetical protein n=1 Tax=Vibrio coralliirubri TaxID=1516159 RepID=UPI0022836E09|nr:hypothetical protein [Vibrio coralliirubri]MCY9861555.1 hypothetical protein [Vibrio coralliirubri]
MKQTDLSTLVAVAEMLSSEGVVAELLSTKGAAINAKAELETAAQSGKPFMVKTPFGVAFGIKKDSEHPIAQHLRNLEQEANEEQGASDEACECINCQAATALMSAADKAIEIGSPVGIDTNIPNIDYHLQNLLNTRDDIEIAKISDTEHFAIAPAGFFESHTCSCGGNCNERSYKDEQEVVQEAQETIQEETQAPLATEASTTQERVLKAVEREILSIYPHAKRAEQGLSVGDVIICHPSEPSVLVTPNNIMEYGRETGYFIITHVGNV